MAVSASSSRRTKKRGDGNGRKGAFLLTINAGSSSLKFALFRADVSLTRVLRGGVERIGLEDSAFSVTDLVSGETERRPVRAPSHGSCIDMLLDLIERKAGPDGVKAIGHRLVHGGPSYAEPQRVTTEMIEELRRLIPLAMEHLPSEIEWIEAFSKRYPKCPQVACFDTAFHSDLPRVSRMLPLPRRLEALGLRRYGFHGLSYEFLMQELSRLDPATSGGRRVILAHLGNGASMAAVRDGKCVDTSMGFTPAAGLVMGKRTGDLDPGIFIHLARTEKMSADEFHRMVNQQSGLLGVSGASSDMRELLALESSDVRAAEAIALFCHQARKWIGSYAAVLGALDTLVFAGGIGENCSTVRSRICDRLGFLGIDLDEGRNQANAPVISGAGGKTVARVIRTDEELMIARSVEKILSNKLRKAG